MSVSYIGMFVYFSMVVMASSSILFIIARQ